MIYLLVKNLVNVDEVTPKTLSRFWKKVIKRNNCWEWTAYTRNGYGRFKINGNLVTAHHFSYELIHGVIPKEYEVDHLCRNKICVNPDHLEAVIKKENILRGFAPTAINSKKTRCIHGHPLSGDNLGMRDDNGGRFCKTCRKNWKPSPKAYELKQQRQKSRKYKDRQNFLKKEKRKLKTTQNDLFVSQEFG